MILYIDTTQNNSVEIGLKEKNKFIAKKIFNSNHTQAEKLLPSIAKLLKNNQLKLGDLKGIEAANRGGSFTSLRIGVITANSLGYALGIPIKGEKGKAKRVKSGELSFNLVKPEYAGDPRITVKRKKDLDNCGKDVKK